MALNFPDSPTLSQVYTDTTSGFSYQWDGVVWQSYSAAAASSIKIIDDLESSFDDVSLTFPLTSSGTPVTPINPQQLRIVLGGIVQEPAVDYNVAGSDIIFTTAPATGLSFSGVLLGGAISPVGLSTGSVYVRQSYSPTGVQTTFTVSGGYRLGYLDVYHNGVKLVVTDDYTATDESTFDLVTPAQNGDTVEAVTFLYTQLYSTKGILDNLLVTGNATISGITTLGNVVKVGGGTTALIVEGDARVTGILTVGTSSITLDGSNNEIKIGTGITISSTGITGTASTVTSAAVSYGLEGTPNVTVGVVTATSVSVSGNVSIAGTLTYEDVTNVDSIGIVTARSGVNVTSGSVVISSGGLTVSGVSTFSSQIQSTQANSTATGGGQIYLNGATGNRIDFNTNGIAAPAFTTRSAGTKIVLYPAISASSVDHAFGIEGGTLWSSVPDTSAQFKWYAGTTNVGTLTGAGNFTVTGNVTGYSDETLKDNIQTIPDALSKVSQLRGVEFDRNDIEGNPHQIGVIAQEVEQVIPEVVTTHDDGIKSVAYGNLVGVLIEAIKELKEEVNELKARLEEV